MARVTGLEPATLGVTGRYSNQLSYTRAWVVVEGLLGEGREAVKASDAAIAKPAYGTGNALISISLPFSERRQPDQR
jgi:hypothetical protein